MTQGSIQPRMRPERLGIEAFSGLSASVSRTVRWRALVTKREPIGTEREPKMAAVCEPGRSRWRSATVTLVLLL